MTTDPDHVCGGWHDPVTRPAPQLRPDETLCRDCESRTTRMLRELGNDLVELETTVARQSATRHTGTSKRREHPPEEPRGDESVGVRERHLPYDDAAARVRDDVAQRLVEWADFVREQTHIVTRQDVAQMFGVPPSVVSIPDTSPRCVHDMVVGTCAICAGLPDVDEELLHVVPTPRPPTERPRRPRPGRVFAAIALLRHPAARNWMRTNEQGPACAMAIGFVRSRVLSAVDRFDRRWWAGPCGADAEAIHLVEGSDGQLVANVRQIVCTADLYAEPGKSVVICDGYRGEPGSGCGAVHPAVTRHSYVVQTVRERWLPLAALLSVMPMLVGKVPDPETVKKWRQRGKLRPIVCLTKHDHDPRGRTGCRVCRGELFAGGQVLDLVQAYTPGRTGPKRAGTVKASAAR